MKTLIVLVIVSLILFAIGMIKLDGINKIDNKKTASLFKDEKVVLFKGLLLKQEDVGGEKNYNHIKNLLNAPYNAQKKIISFIGN